MNRVAVATLFAPRQGGPWLFGRTTDLLAFGGSAALSFALLALGDVLRIDDEEAPVWIWLALVVCIDVAHVWSTAFRVYLDPDEVARRRVLYLGLPVALYGLGVAVALVSATLFWRLLAYAAVFHFVRQQAGWVALYRRRGHESDEVDRRLDNAAIYACTLFPLIWWHAHLPREFHWLLRGDFVSGLAAPVAYKLEPAYWAIMLAFCARQVYLRVHRRPINTGKVLVVLTTWACWHVGMIHYDSDYAFTVTNVIIHGVPYLVLTYRYGRARADSGARGGVSLLAQVGLVGFLGFILVMAFAEETLWDRLVWHDHGSLFGASADLSALALAFVVPLLALPQAVHYALDGWVWRVRGDNPLLAAELGKGGEPAASG